jgi:hypothetical protein
MLQLDKGLAVKENRKWAFHMRNAAQATQSERRQKWSTAFTACIPDTSKSPDLAAKRLSAGRIVMVENMVNGEGFFGTPNRRLGEKGIGSS